MKTMLFVVMIGLACAQSEPEPTPTPMIPCPLSSEPLIGYWLDYATEIWDEEFRGEGSGRGLDMDSIRVDLSAMYPGMVFVGAHADYSGVEIPRGGCPRTVWLPLRRVGNGHYCEHTEGELAIVVC